MPERGRDALKLKRAKQAEPLRPLLMNCESDESELARTGEKIRGLEQELAELAMPLGEAEKAMQDRMCELSKRRPELELSAGRLREAMPSYAHLDEKLKEAVNARQEADRLKNEMEAAEKTLRELEIRRKELEGQGARLAEVPLALSGMQGREEAVKVRLSDLRQLQSDLELQERLEHDLEDKKRQVLAAQRTFEKAEAEYVGDKPACLSPSRPVSWHRLWKKVPPVPSAAPCITRRRRCWRRKQSPKSRWKRLRREGRGRNSHYGKRHRRARNTESVQTGRLSWSAR